VLGVEICHHLPRASIGELTVTAAAILLLGAPSAAAAGPQDKGHGIAKLPASASWHGRSIQKADPGRAILAVPLRSALTVRPGDGYGRVGGSSRVAVLQATLLTLGYSTGPVDGLYGPHTEGAVRSFQAGSGRPATGVADAGTLRALGARSAAVKRMPLGPRSPRFGDGYGRPGGSPPVQTIQAMLTALGYRVGPVDGVFGPRTRASVEWFQIKHAFRPSGVVDLATLRELSVRSSGTAVERPAARPSAPASPPTPATPAAPRPANSPSHGAKGTGRLPLILVLLAAMLIALALLALAWPRRRALHLPRRPSLRLPRRPALRWSGLETFLRSGRQALRSPAAAAAGAQRIIGRKWGAVRASRGSSAPSQPAAPSARIDASSPQIRVLAPLATRPDHRPGRPMALGYAVASKTREFDRHATTIAQACGQRGWELSNVVREPATHERLVLRRPGFRRAVRQLSGTAAARLVVSRLEHVARTPAELSRVLQLCTKVGVDLIALDVGLDTGTREGRLAARRLAANGGARRGHGSGRRKPSPDKTAR
jgi:peptidoglycan hydrolase-like protein with peptidoglycan-binding domain